MLRALLDRIRLRRPRFPRLEREVLAVRDLPCLKRALGWNEDPILTGDHLDAFEYPEDLNQRRRRDAEVLGAACRNGTPRILLEIGTAFGHGTALMAQNAPQGTVHTVNLPAEEAAQGGRLVTCLPARAEIGRYWRERGCTNVVQVFANTATWQPSMPSIDVAFIDGCHDADFVYGDTRKILALCHPGSLVLWHDFSPALAPRYPWIAAVCQGVERLLREHLVQGPIYHLRDSWVGLYRVP